MVTALLHQPLGCTRGTADANGLRPLEPFHVNLLGTLYLVTVGIDTLALVEQHLSIGALATTDKKNQVVPGCEAGDIGHTVRHLSADGIEALEHSSPDDMVLTVVDDAMELVQALGGLGIEVDVAREVETFHILEFLDDDGMTVSLPYQSQDLRMTVLAKDDNLRVGMAVILFLDAFLQLQHHGTGGINDFYIVPLCHQISLGRFAVGAKKHLHTMQLLHLVMVDGDEPCLMQPFHLHTIVNNVTQAIELATLRQFLLCLLDGSGHAEAEATAVVYFYLHDKLIKN